MHSLTDLTEFAVNVALQRGVNEAEAYGYMGHFTEGILKENRSVVCNSHIKTGMGVMTVKANSVGFCYTTQLEKNAIKHCVEKTIKISRTKPPDPAWCGLPEIRSASHVSRTFDPKLFKIECDEVISLSETMLESATTSAQKKLISISGGVIVAFEKFCVSNSTGGNATDKSTMMAAWLTTLAKDGIDLSNPGFKIATSRMLDVDVQSVAKESSTSAISSLGAKKVSSATLPVVVAPYAFSRLLKDAFIPFVCGDLALGRASPYIEELGKSVCIDGLSITDNGTIVGGLASSSIDAEGVATTKTDIIRDGILASFLHNTYTGNRMGVLSTGNAIRRTSNPYEDMSSVGPTNLIIDGRNNLKNDRLLEEIKRGLLIKNIVKIETGRVERVFYGTVVDGFLVENGAIKDPIGNTVIAIHMPSLLHQIVCLGSDCEQVGFPFRGAVVTPPVVLSNVKIV